jgi:hypothetical protein
MLTDCSEVRRSSEWQGQGVKRFHLSWLCEADGVPWSWSLEGRDRPRELVLGAIGDKRVEIPALGSDSRRS